MAPVFRAGANVSVGSRPVSAAAGVTVPSLQIGATLLESSTSMAYQLINLDASNPSAIDLAFGDSILQAVAGAYDNVPGSSQTSPVYVLEASQTRSISFERGSGANPSGHPLSQNCVVTATLADGTTTSATVSVAPILAIETAYDNPLSVGDRTAAIAATMWSFVAGDPEKFINGSTASEAWYSGSSAGGFLKFDFDQAGTGATYRITEIKHQQGGTQTHGVHQIQASNDDAVWVDVSSTFTLGGANEQLIPLTTGELDHYRYYRFFRISGSMNSGPYVTEIEFEISTDQNTP